LARIIYQRNRIDPTKISGPYSLLAVMLLVAEILFALWFYKAESSTERSIAGLIMASVFVCLMIVVLKMNRAPSRAKMQNVRETLLISYHSQKVITQVLTAKSQMRKKGNAGELEWSWGIFSSSKL
jgi:hypothetical protein